MMPNKILLLFHGADKLIGHEVQLLQSRFAEQGASLSYETRHPTSPSELEKAVEHLEPLAVLFPRGWRAPFKAVRLSCPVLTFDYEGDGPGRLVECAPA